jgi:hypothetical protein
MTKEDHTPKRRGMAPFMRVSWVSECAGARWRVRFAAIRAAWSQIELRSVVAGLRRAAITATSAEDLECTTRNWEMQGLAVLPLELRVRSSHYISRQTAARESGPLEFAVAVVIPEALEELRSVWERQDQLGIADLLGYPRCCAAAFRARFERHPMRDPTWPMAVASSDSIRKERRTIAIHPTPEANVLLRWLHARAVPHLPCCFGCEASIALGRNLIALGARSGFEEEINWLAEVLAWPVEWSALHGMAEIRTPVCRVMADTDYSNSRYVVQYLGTAWPDDGAQGLAFPYQNARAGRLTGSSGFRRGLAR